MQRALPFLVFALVCTGCGPTLVPLSGKVTVDDKPLDAGMVSFVPDVEKGNKFQGGIIAKLDKGTYTVSTDGKAGIPPGAYKVLVSNQMPPMGADKMPPPPTVKIPVKFSAPGPDNLRYEVKEGGTYDIQVSTKAK